MASASITAPRIHDGHAAELAYWARLLDESPEEIRRAIQHIGPELTAVRSFLFGRQMGFDFGGGAEDVAASPPEPPTR